MFIQTESTPNPQTLKFLPGRDVLTGATRDFADATAAQVSPLAEAIFSIEGVTRVYLGEDFIAVTKQEAQDWAWLKPFVLGAVMDHFVAGRPVLLDGARPEAATHDESAGAGADA